MAEEAFGSRFQDWYLVPASGFEARLKAARHFGTGNEIGQPLAVGCWQSGLVPDDPQRGWVMSVYTRPAARGLGYSDALMNQLAADARAKGMTSLGLHVVTTNAAALGLYRRLGYVDSGTKGVVSDLGYPEYRMILDLNRDDPRSASAPLGPDH